MGHVDDDGLLLGWLSLGACRLEGAHSHLLNSDTGSDNCEQRRHDLSKHPPLEVRDFLIDVVELRFNARKTLLRIIGELLKRYQAVFHSVIVTAPATSCKRTHFCL